MQIITRYLIREILLPFLMILFVMTFALLMGKILQLIDLMINKGVDLVDIVRLVSFLIPSFLFFTIPISLLIAILIGLGRLSADNEITVLKSSGVSIYRIAKPVIFASAAAFLMTAVTSLFLVPYSNQAMRSLLFDIAQKKAAIGIKERVFNDDFNGILLYADKVRSDGNFMEGVLVLEKRIGEAASTIIAEKAYLVSDDRSMTVTLRLLNGSSHTVSESYKNYRKMDFKIYDVNLNIESPLAEAQAALKKRPEDMTVFELLRQMKQPSAENASYEQLAIELNKKMTIPLSCLVFGILGIPLGITPTRAVKSRGFVVGIITVLIYYLVQITGNAFVETGRLAPVIGAWAPLALFSLLSVYLFGRVAREKPFSLVSNFGFSRARRP